MDLNPIQRDAMTELISIGYGRAAHALSELTGHRVTLDVPRVSMQPLTLMPSLLGKLVAGEVASVNQPFGGPIEGNAFLMIDEKSAVQLSRLLCEAGTPEGRLDATGRETITEIGNILLNACLGVFGNVLQVHVSFAVPRLQVTVAEQVLDGINLKAPEMHYGLMIHTNFHLRDSDVTGYMIIVLGISSLDRLLKEISQWEHRQTA